MSGKGRKGEAKKDLAKRYEGGIVCNSLDQLFVG